MGQKGSESDGVPVVSYCMTDLSGTVLAERGADRPYYAASTVKLAVLIAAMRAVDAGALSLDQQLVSAHRFVSVVPGGSEFGEEGDEIDQGMPESGAQVSLREVLWRMIAVSSNEATNMVVGLVGLEAVAGAFAVCGAQSSRMQRLIGDLEARATGLSHIVTARDLAAVVRAIVTGAAAGPESTSVMVGMLQDQEIAYLGDGLPAGTHFGSKSGWVEGIQHDVAFVAPSGELDARDTYVLSVCSRGYAEDAATEMLAALSRFAWDRRPGA